MPTIYNASQCPAPVPWGTVYYAVDKRTPGATVNPWETFDSAGPAALSSSVFNRGTAMSALSARYGAGKVMVAYGLALSAGSGLTCNVSAGHAMIDGPVELKNGGTRTLTDNATNFVWLKQDATLTHATTTAKPAGNCVFLGIAVTSGGVITSVDSSGVVFSQYGEAYRVTADDGAPSDTPDASVRIYSKTDCGTFYWDGSLWRPVGYSLLVIGGSKSNAAYTLTQSEAWTSVVKLAWTGWSGGQNLIVPTSTAWRQDVWNTTGQTATVKTSGGSGIAVANNRVASLFCDGTNVRRLTADTDPTA